MTFPCEMSQPEQQLSLVMAAKNYMRKCPLVTEQSVLH